MDASVSPPDSRPDRSTAPKHPAARRGAAAIRLSRPATPVADPQTLTCSCTEWRMHRVCFPASDPRRLCKHLVAVLGLPDAPLPPPLARHRGRLGYLRSLSRGFPFCRHIRHLKAEDRLYRLYYPLRPLDPWVEIHAPEGSYGYDPTEDRWSMDSRPRDAEALEEAVRRFLRQRRPDESGEPDAAGAPPSSPPPEAPPLPEPLARLLNLLSPAALYAIVFLVCLLGSTGGVPPAEDFAIAGEPAPAAVCETVGGALAAGESEDLDLLLDASRMDDERILRLYRKGQIVVLPDRAAVRADLTEPLADRARIRYPEKSLDLWVSRDSVRCHPAPGPTALSLLSPKP